jgi:hypothetical protein
MINKHKRVHKVKHKHMDNHHKHAHAIIIIIAILVVVGSIILVVGFYFGMPDNTVRNSGNPNMSEKEARYARYAEELRSYPIAPSEDLEKYKKELMKSPKASKEKLEMYKQELES